MGVFFFDKNKYHIFLLQANQEATKVAELSLFELLKEGGLLMIPIAICSIIMCVVFIERFLYIKSLAKLDPNFSNKIKEQLENDNKAGAISICKNTQHPIARMIEKGIQRMDKPYEQIEKSMEQVGKLEVYQMEKNTSILSTIAGIAPMFGFLGTIAGMIILFFNIQHDGFSLEHIAGGIYTKMVTSAVGLIIGLLSYVAYNYINAQINKAVNKMEAAAADFLDTIA
ncbi:MAG: MotA/TolQ/ExbB proton channel family protein [Chitinophagia bacterium]|nr:MotA/TolQ/ExbB proton channel family protein [Chitinophagia bacterium]